MAGSEDQNVMRYQKRNEEKMPVDKSGLDIIDQKVTLVFYLLFSETKDAVPGNLL